MVCSICDTHGETQLKTLTNHNAQPHAGDQRRRGCVFLLHLMSLAKAGQLMAQSRSCQNCLAKSSSCQGVHFDAPKQGEGVSRSTIPTGPGIDIEACQLFLAPSPPITLKGPDIPLA